MARKPPVPPPPPLPDAKELQIAQDFADGMVEVVGALVGGNGVAPPGASTQTTFTWITRQNVAAGTLLSKTISVACYLVRLTASASITVSRAPVTYPATGSQFVDSFIAHIPPVSLQPWVGREKLNPLEVLYVDSLGGLGTSDMFTMTFERI